MIHIIIIVIAIVVVLTIIMFMLLKRIVRTINEQTKVFFMMKLQSYDDMIEAKQQELDNLKAHELEKEETEENVDLNKPNLGRGIVIPKDAPIYKVEGLVDIIRKIEKQFNHDYEEIINSFIEKSKNENTEHYNELLKVRKTLDKYGLFNIITETKDEQYEIVKGLNLNPKIMKEYHKYFGNFTFNNFMKFLEAEMAKHDPTIYIFVGHEEENYDNLAENIKTIYDKNIIKGVKIRYHNKMYEYHLSY